MSHQCDKPRTQGNLHEVHEDLQAVAQRAIELCKEAGLDFIVTDGNRTLAEQQRFVATGKSQTMKSRHLGGFALDFVAVFPDGRISWDWDDMTAIAQVFKTAAAELEIPVEWGGDWKHFKDSPHIQLAKESYPDVLAV